MTKKIVFLASFFVAFTLAAQTQQDAQMVLNNSDYQFFIENKGQWPNEALYLTRIGGVDVWITTQGMVYDFFRMEEIEKTNTDPKNNIAPHEKAEYNRYGHVIKLLWQQTNPNPLPIGNLKQPGYYNYFIGNDSTQWASFVGLYKEAHVKNIYNGIDLKYYFEQGTIRYDYIVQPGADLKQIVLELQGSDNTSINAQGDLVFTTRFGEVKQAGLFCYQQIEGNKQEISAQFTLTGKDTVRFVIDRYNPQYPLIL